MTALFFPKRCRTNTNIFSSFNKNNGNHTHFTPTPDPPVRKGAWAPSGGSTIRQRHLEGWNPRVISKRRDGRARQSAAQETQHGRLGKAEAENSTDQKRCEQESEIDQRNVLQRSHRPQGRMGRARDGEKGSPAETSPGRRNPGKNRFHKQPVLCHQNRASSSGQKVDRSHPVGANRKNCRHTRSGRFGGLRAATDVRTEHHVHVRRTTHQRRHHCAWAHHGLALERTGGHQRPCQGVRGQQTDRDVHALGRVRRNVHGHAKPTTGSRNGKNEKTEETDPPTAH